MAANAVLITIDDSSKTLRFGETLTTGSNYAVRVDGGRVVAGASGVLVIVDECGVQLASCSLADGAGTLSTDTEQMRRRFQGMPTGSVVPVGCYVRDLENLQNAAAGIAMVKVVDHWTGSTAQVRQVSYVGPRGESAYELAVKDGFVGSLHQWLQSLALRSAYAYDRTDGRLKPLGVYTNAAGEKVPTIDLDGEVMDGLPIPASVVADGSDVGRTLGERFAEVTDVMDFGAWAEGSLYRNVADDGTVTYDANPNAARVALTGTRHHDDTEAIQAAIDHAASQGGGTVYFPNPGDENRYYRIDGDPKAYYNPASGKATDSRFRNAASGADVDDHAASETNAPNQPLRAQLFIPPDSNVCLEGESPPMALEYYKVLGGSGTMDFKADTFRCRSAVLRSTRDAPGGNVGYLERPWAVIAAPEGEVKTDMRVASSSEVFSMLNLEVRVHLDCRGESPKLYPTMGAVNAMNVRRMHVENCFFGLDNNIGSNAAAGGGRCLQKSPTTTVGLFGAIEDCAEHKIVHVTVQGFKFGVVLPEMTNCSFLHVSNTEYALCFLDCTHATLVSHLSTHANRRCICALPIPRPAWDDDDNPTTTLEYPHPFGCTIKYTEWDASQSVLRNRDYKPQINVRVTVHDYETGHFSKPFVSQMRYGIWDPQDRMYGSIVYHQGYTGDVGSEIIRHYMSSQAEDHPDYRAKRFLTDHCLYDHRYGGADGEVARPFSADIETTDGVEDEYKIEQDVRDWMDAEWAEADGYDFLDDDDQVITNSDYWKGPAPCPGFVDASDQIVRYTAPDYGSYYPILGASHVLALSLKDVAENVVPEITCKDGHAMRRNANDGALALSGGTGYADGNATLYLYGKSAASNAGFLVLNAAGVKGAAFAAGGMPKNAPSSVDLKSTFPFTAVRDGSSNVYVYEPTKSGWITIVCTVPAASSIEVRVYESSTNQAVLAGATILPRSGASCATVPCPAGSYVAAWIVGTALGSGALETCRFWPCGADA